ncbi:MAG: methyltransferase domain-containing protein [Sphingomonadales bacterium]|nr:methyltransferase domain-containing protein [Sphingomonadales bacterium]
MRRLRASATPCRFCRLCHGCRGRVRLHAGSPRRFGWPDGAAVRSALVDECELPLESAIDVALIVQGLEFSDAPAEMLKEIWRVLAPQGRHSRCSQSPRCVGPLR